MWGSVCRALIDIMQYLCLFRIHLTAYSPLGSPDSSNIRGGTGTSLLNHEIVKEIASETGKSCGQILIRWAFQRGTSVIPKSVTPCRIIENFDVFSWELSPSQMKKLASFPQERFLTGTFWLKKGGPYSTLDELWA